MYRDNTAMLKNYPNSPRRPKSLQLTEHIYSERFRIVLAASVTTKRGVPTVGPGPIIEEEIPYTPCTSVQNVNNFCQLILLKSQSNYNDLFHFNHCLNKSPLSK